MSGEDEGMSFSDHPCHVDWCADLDTELYDTLADDGTEVWYCHAHWPDEVPWPGDAGNTGNTEEAIP